MIFRANDKSEINIVTFFAKVLLNTLCSNCFHVFLRKKQKHEEIFQMHRENKIKKIRKKKFSSQKWTEILEFLKPFSLLKLIFIENNKLNIAAKKSMSISSPRQKHISSYVALLRKKQLGKNYLLILRKPNLLLKLVHIFKKYNISVIFRIFKTFYAIILHGTIGMS